MAKTTTPTTDAPAPNESTAPDLEGMSALEVLAAAGDEAARQALGTSTIGGDPSGALREAGAAAGFTLGQPAPRDVYLDMDGKVADPSASKDGFRGSQIAFKGSAVTAATLVSLKAAGEL